MCLAQALVTKKKTKIKSFHVKFRWWCLLCVYVDKSIRCECTIKRGLFYFAYHKHLHTISIHLIEMPPHLDINISRVYIIWRKNRTKTPTNSLWLDLTLVGSSSSILLGRCRCLVLMWTVNDSSWTFMWDENEKVLFSNEWKQTMRHPFVQFVWTNGKFSDYPYQRWSMEVNELFFNAGIWKLFTIKWDGAFNEPIWLLVHSMRAVQIAFGSYSRNNTNNFHSQLPQPQPSVSINSSTVISNIV